MTSLSLQQITTRIRTELCASTISVLTDKNLLNDYKECESVKKEVFKLSEILGKYVDTTTKEKIIEEYLPSLVPPGTKGVIRGNKFNSIVKQTVLDIGLDPKLYEIRFEKVCSTRPTAEIPDWYIRNLSNDKIIIGMNQLDLWSGGQQINRGFKYLENTALNTDSCKLLCVVCNDPQLKSESNKTYKLFDIGFRNNTLCYIKSIKPIVHSFFGISTPELR